MRAPQTTGRDALKRAARTFAQGAIAVLALLALPVLNGVVADVVAGREAAIDLSLWRSIAFASIAGGLAALLSWGQNALEDKTGHTILPK